MTKARFAAATLAILIGIASFVSAPAMAATSSFHYTGYAAGSKVVLLGGVVRSDFTSASALDGTEVPVHHRNTLASVEVGKLASVGAISTSASAVAAGDGAATEYTATTAKVSLLDGLIKADAIETINKSTVNSTTKTGGVDTTFVKLEIAGTVLPLKISKNFTVTIPGIARVVLNESKTAPNGNGLITEGSAIHVNLLADRDNAPAGSTIIINPTRTQNGPTGTGTPIGGQAYVTSVHASVGPAIQAKSGPTAAIGVPAIGTGGTTIYNSTLAVDLPKLLYVGAVESSATGTTTAALQDSSTTAQAARVNLLNGLITADAVKASSRTKKVGSAAETLEQSTSLVNIKLAGIPLKLDPKANLVINIPGLVKIVVNEQVTVGGRKTVTGLHVTLLAPAGGYGVGADVRVAVASSWIGK
ncbi:hypothetical protein J2X11_001461 [Aeromicrobium panaciterrae]|uniref:DUF5666 domain-containing protein n=1 Tax=Aeromicrobium panaciterrae TaxID=363861 RepID=A0ABU1UN63_9ACTN|nr:choice-of-anchor P family protein [Aeromicrobium panaciterrae]MDR7086622.1 hypothetical protein [Aeromicrobium panaciterrae]